MKYRIPKASLKKCYHLPNLPHYNNSKQTDLSDQYLEIKYLINDTVNFSFFYRLLYRLCCFGNGFRYLFCSSSGKIEEVTFHRGEEKDLKKDLFTSSSLTRLIFLSLQTFGYLLESFFQNNLTQLLAYKELLKSYLFFSRSYSLVMMIKLYV